MTRAGSVYVVGGGPWQRWLIRAVRALGLRAVVADGNAGAPGFADADDARIVNIADHDALAGDVRRVAPDAIVTGASDVGARAAAAVAARLGMTDRLAGPSRRPAGLDPLFNKQFVHEALGRAGIPMARWEVAGRGEALGPVAARVGYPVVVKPLDSAGGRGVTCVADPAAIDAAERFALAFSRDGRLLVESFVGGDGVGLELVVVEGAPAAWAATNPHFEPDYISPSGHSLPTRLSRADESALVALGVRAAAALGIEEGPLNFDARWTDAGPVVLEVNPRAGGSNISEVVYHATGVDLAQGLVLRALGERPRFAARWQRAAATHLLLTRHAGPVASVTPPPEHPAVVERAVLVRPGDHLPPPGQGAHLAGWVLAAGASLAGVESTVCSLARGFEVR